MLFENYRSDMKRTWQVISELLGNKKRAKPAHEIMIDGAFSTDNKLIANGFNKFFAEIPKKIHKNLPKSTKHFKDYFSHYSNRSLFLNPTCFLEVKKIILSLQNKSSTGLDKVTPGILKIFPDNIIACLVHIFNLSLKQGKFITEFKLAKIIPIPKKGDLTIMTNYRPISLLSCISKILEKLMYRRLSSFLQKCNLTPIIQCLKLPVKIWMMQLIYSLKLSM